MDRKLTPEEQYEISVRDAMQRLFASEDGKMVLEFLESTVGYEYAMPTENLKIAEGARRVVCMIKNMMKDTPIENFLNHCAEHYHDGKLLK